MDIIKNGCGFCMLLWKKNIFWLGCLSVSLSVYFVSRNVSWLIGNNHMKKNIFWIGCLSVSLSVYFVSRNVLGLVGNIHLEKKYILVRLSVCKSVSKKYQ